MWNFSPFVLSIPKKTGGNLNCGPPSGKHVDAATGDDGDEQVDATSDEGNNDNVCNDDNNRFVCTIVNHPGPCGWKIAHQCICEDYEVPIL